jgi:ribosome-associated protein
VPDPSPQSAVRFPESQALACLAARAADDKKADDTIVLAVGELLNITEYFVVTSASNRRLVRTIVESVEELVRAELDRPPLRIEGLTEAQWVLMDYGDVVVHVFAEEMRQYYEIERLYRDVPRVEWQSVVPADQG